MVPARLALCFLSDGGDRSGQWNEGTRLLTTKLLLADADSTCTLRSSENIGSWHLRIKAIWFHEKLTPTKALSSHRIAYLFKLWKMSKPAKTD